MIWYLLVECSDDTLHLVEVPPGMPGGAYRQGRSIGAFFEARGGRVGDKWVSKSYCDLGPAEYDRLDWSRDINDCIESLTIRGRADEWPDRITHKSLWEFYKHIGYDHKRKKYDLPKETG